MPVFIKNFFASMLFLIYTKGQLKFPIFMQDNEPCHKAKTVKFLEEEGIAVMKWPPQSPDMNPIENVWKSLERKLRTEILKY